MDDSRQKFIEAATSAISDNPELHLAAQSELDRHLVQNPSGLEPATERLIKSEGKGARWIRVMMILAFVGILISLGLQNENLQRIPAAAKASDLFVWSSSASSSIGMSSSLSLSVSEVGETTAI